VGQAGAAVRAGQRGTVDHQVAVGLHRNIHPVFKAVFAIFLRANYTEEEVEGFIQSKKDK
jgi:hypothetical protein